ncbi:TPA: hypothetical protein SAO52_002063 [Burkholderia vietnamiensis]|nr:hypothetical protein [Burkholderia vietnamiensis]HEF4837343.1 hypothetical protein [Burkholderia vietnamiensis]
MNEITPTEAQYTACVLAYFDARADGQVSRIRAGLTAALNVDPLASLVNDMALALEMISDEDDAARERTKQPLLTSGVRTMLDVALIKAGRKAAPTAVRHVTIAGGAL